MPVKFFSLVCACFLISTTAYANFTYDSTVADLQLISGSHDGGFLLNGDGSGTTVEFPYAGIFLFSFLPTSNSATPISENYSYSFVDTIAVTNVPSSGDPKSGSAGSGSLTLNIVLNYRNSQFQLDSTINGALGGIGLDASLTAGGVEYLFFIFDLQGSITSPSFNSFGNGFAVVTALATVPEPSSITMLGASGLLGLVGWTRRRSRVAASLVFSET